MSSSSLYPGDFPHRGFPQGNCSALVLARHTAGLEHVPHRGFSYRHGGTDGRISSRHTQQEWRDGQSSSSGQQWRNEWHIATFLVIGTK